MTVEELKTQLDHSEAELEQMKVVCHRLEGVIMLLKHQLKDLETPSTDAPLDLVADNLGA
jgi:hypothetical protein